MNLSEQVLFIMEKMNKSGERADVVGGCVRDFLLGCKPDDYDLTTSASPEKTKEIFAEYKTVDTGIKHGTVTLVLGGKPYEITTYRIDGEYKDSRHPEQVTFSKNIEDDLSRRDFTMNAIAYNPTDGLTDPFFGREDIKNKLIRAVGDARVRFTEDALRILRAVRFSSKLGFEIEGNTAAAIFEKRELLKKVSAERILSEWKKLLAGDFAARVIEEYLAVTVVFLPELAPLSGIKLPDFSTLSVTERAALLFYLASLSAQTSDFALRRLKSDNESRELTVSFIKCLYFLGENKKNLATDSALMELPYLFGVEAALGALKILAALGKISIKAHERLLVLLNGGAPYRISDLKIKGDDLIALGIGGKAIGNTLSALLLRVIKGEILNERDALLNAVKSAE